MKKTSILIAALILMFTVSSCKKYYTCTCYMSGTIEWQDEVEATSKAKAEKIVEDDGCNSFGNTIECN